MRLVHPEFRTVVALGAITVTGVLADPLPQQGSIEISGDLRTLCCDQALELADALLLVVMRMDAAAEKRRGTVTGACRDGSEAQRLKSNERSAE